MPDDVFDDAKQRFREHQSSPPTEGNVTNTTIGYLNSGGVGVLSYTFDIGDNWKHYIELEETRKGSLDGDQAIINEQGAAPPQYPEVDD